MGAGRWSPGLPRAAAGLGVAAAITAGALATLARPGSEELCAGLPEPAAARLTPSRDLYCVRLSAAARREGVAGAVSLLPAPTPFGAGVTPDGRNGFEGVLPLRGLPEPASLGPYSVYVAWLTTPTFSSLIKLGPVGNGTNPVGATGSDAMRRMKEPGA